MSEKVASFESQSNNGTDKKTPRYILSDQSYELLRETQEKVFATTEITPSVRKLVNLMITPENLAKIADQLINSLSD